MFKVLIALSLFIAIQGQLIGGFKNRPDLLSAPATENMIKIAIADVAQTENILLSPVNVLSVATQVVNGLNYRVVFTARSFSDNDTHVCIAKFYQPIGATPALSAVNCA